MLETRRSGRQLVWKKVSLQKQYLVVQVSFIDVCNLERIVTYAPGENTTAPYCLHEGIDVSILRNLTKQRASRTHRAACRWLIKLPAHWIEREHL